MPTRTTIKGRRSSENLTKTNRQTRRHGETNVFSSASSCRAAARLGVPVIWLTLCPRRALRTERGQRPSLAGTYASALVRHLSQRRESFRCPCHRRSCGGLSLRRTDSHDDRPDVTAANPATSGGLCGAVQRLVRCCKLNCCPQSRRDRILSPCHSFHGGVAFGLRRFLCRNNDVVFLPTAVYFRLL